MSTESLMCGPAQSPKKKIMCGPSAGSAMWRKNIQADVRRANLEKGRKVRQENLSAKSKNKQEE
jgi:hypothetical protein